MVLAYSSATHLHFPISLLKFLLGCLITHRFERTSNPTISPQVGSILLASLALISIPVVFESCLFFYFTSRTLLVLTCFRYNTPSRQERLSFYYALGPKFTAIFFSVSVLYIYILFATTLRFCTPITVGLHIFLSFPVPHIVY